MPRPPHPPAHPGFSRFRSLKGLAHNLACRFSTSSGHFAQVALQRGLGPIRIDLLEGGTDPAGFGADRDLILLRMCQGDLHRYLEKSGPDTVTAVTLIALFQRRDPRPAPRPDPGPDPGPDPRPNPGPNPGPAPGEGPFESWVTARITDARGRTWTWTRHERGEPFP